MSVFSLDSWLTLIPVVHGSGAYASALRKELLTRPFDALAVPLPASFATDVIRGVKRLPALSAVVRLSAQEDRFDELDDSQETTDLRGTYVPIDPCQAVIAAIRFALGERKPIVWIDSESDQIENHSPVFADCYAIRHTTLERFCAAMLPAIPPPDAGLGGGNLIERIDTMAEKILAMRNSYRSIVALCPLEAWPWLREAIQKKMAEDASDSLERSSDEESQDEFYETDLYAIDSRSYLFALGELPFITGLVELARQDFQDDDQIVAQGLKELFVTARSSYRQELAGRARQITPLLISQCLKYVRNQTLLERRMTPSFYTLAKSAQQMMGDTYTMHLVNAAIEYPLDDPIANGSEGLETMRLGIGVGDLPGWGRAKLISRLPGPPMQWHSLELKRRVEKKDQRRWESRWNPYMQCSWPEEDTQIESFRNRVAERARQILGADLARIEKFTTSIMDGLDLRETLRHWYDGSLYVKVNPPSIGQVNVTVMIFDPEPDPREYSWRATWFSEHPEESTLAFYATPFNKQMIGPGIAMATYGGSMFIYPPRPILDIWKDSRLDFTDTLEQRLVAAACMHSESRHVALLSPTPPGYALKKIAKRYSRKLVHVPLSHFSDSAVQQLRIFHVLNGKHVRSYAADFIRKS